MRRGTKACQSRTRAGDIATAVRGGCAVAALLAIAVFAGGCESTIIKHGTQFHDGDLQQIQSGMSQEQVRMNLGTPATTAVVGTGHVVGECELGAPVRKSARGWAMPVSRPRRYRTPRPITAYGLAKIPRSFRYLGGEPPPSSPASS